MSNLVVVRTYPDKIHADLASSYLESEGIESFVTSPSKLPGSYLIAEWGDGMIPHELKVAEEDLKAAEAALAETESGLAEDWDADADASNADHVTDTTPEAAAPAGASSPAPGLCPACGGPRDADDPRFVTVRRYLMALIALFAVLAVAFAVVSGTPYFALLAVSWTVLAGVFLVLRAYFIRSRCGGCGHYRVRRGGA